MMNKILEALLDLINYKLMDKSVSLEKLELLKEIKTELVMMKTKVWTIDDIEEVSEKLEDIAKRLKE